MIRFAGHVIEVKNISIEQINLQKKILENL